jgi:hypothetical protein
MAKSTLTQCIPALSKNPRVTTLVIALGLCGLVAGTSIYSGVRIRAAEAQNILANEQEMRANQLDIAATVGAPKDTVTSKEGLPRAISAIYCANGIGTVELNNIIDDQEKALVGESSNQALLYVAKKTTSTFGRFFASKDAPLTVTPNPLGESFDLAELNAQYKGFFPDSEKDVLSAGLAAFSAANDAELSTRTPDKLRVQNLPDGLAATLPDADGKAARSIFSDAGRKAAQEYTKSSAGAASDMDAAYLYNAYKAAVTELSVGTSEYQAMGKAYLFVPLHIALNADGAKTKLAKGASIDFKGTEAEKLLLSSVGSGSVAATSYLLRIMNRSPGLGDGINPALAYAANLWIAGQLESELLSPRGFAVIKEKQLAGMAKGLAILADNAPELSDTPYLQTAIIGHLAASVYNDGLLSQATSVQALSFQFQGAHERFKAQPGDNSAVFSLYGKADAATAVALKVAPSVFETIDARKALLQINAQTD